MYPEFEQHMAMAFGDEFAGDDLHAYQLADFAESCEINKELVARRLALLATKLSTILQNGYSPEIQSQEEEHYFKEYRSLILARCQSMLAQAKLGNIH